MPSSNNWMLHEPARILRPSTYGLKQFIQLTQRPVNRGFPRCRSGQACSFQSNKTPQAKRTAPVPPRAGRIPENATRHTTSRPSTGSGPSAGAAGSAPTKNRPTRLDIRRIQQGGEPASARAEKQSGVKFPWRKERHGNPRSGPPQSKKCNEEPASRGGGC